MVYYALSAHRHAMKMTRPFSLPRGQRYSVMPVNNPTIDIARIDRHAGVVVVVVDSRGRAKRVRAVPCRAEPRQAMPRQARQLGRTRFAFFGGRFI